MTFGAASTSSGFVRVASEDPCPCGGESFGGCCAPILAGAPAESAEKLMRSRYTAFVVGDRAHLERSWHPATRPADLGLDPAMRWRGLDVVDARTSGEEATVEFRARWESAGERGTLAERSRFVRCAGRWVYRDDEVSREW